MRNERSKNKYLTHEDEFAAKEPDESQRLQRIPSACGQWNERKAQKTRVFLVPIFEFFSRAVVLLHWWYSQSGHFLFFFLPQFIFSISFLNFVTAAQIPFKTNSRFFFHFFAFNICDIAIVEASVKRAISERKSNYFVRLLVENGTSAAVAANAFVEQVPMCRLPLTSFQSEVFIASFSPRIGSASAVNFYICLIYLSHLCYARLAIYRACGFLSILSKLANGSRSSKYSHY